MEWIKNSCYKIVRWISPDIAENVEGDLEEVYQRSVESKGRFLAMCQFMLEWLTCLKLILNSTSGHPTFSFSSHIKMSCRMLIKHRVYTGISLSGLTLGLVAFFMIFAFERTELSFDRHHSKANRIYRLNYDLTERNEKLPWAIVTGRWAPLIAEKFPEVESFVRITPTWGSKSLMKTSKTSRGQYEDGFMWADSTIMSVFDFDVVAGDPVTPIARPNTIMISQGLATKYFGQPDLAIGQTLNRDNQTDYVVTAVFQDVPSTSHFHPQMIASILTGTTREEREGFWNYSYILLKDGANPSKLESAFPELISEHVERTPFPRLLLQPLLSIYLESKLMYEFEQVGNKFTTRLFMGVGLFILFIAVINFINLSTAYGINRMKEIGLKKVLGADRASLIWQIMIESTLLTLIAVALSFALSYGILPYVEVMIGKSLNVSGLLSFNNGFVLLSFILGLGILSGAYPAYYISAFRPQQIFNRNLHVRKRSIRKGLSIFQFAMSISLIVGSIVVYQQLQYFQTKDTGMEAERALVIPLDYAQNLGSSYEAFRHKSLQNPHVKNMSLMSSLPGELIRMWVGNVRPSVGGEDDKLRVKIFNTDYDFIKTLGIRMAKGRDYSRSFATDTSDAVIINETAARALGISDLDNASIYSYSPTQQRDLNVIGIVEDFHFASLHSTIEPLVIYNKPGTENKGKLVVRMDTEDIHETLSYLEQVWKIHEPDREFESYFLNDYFQTKYTKEQVTMKLLLSFTFLAIFIACLGLFALASYVMRNRQKEIGVRKVLGASIAHLWSLLTLEFVWLILVSFLIATPFAYFLLDDWLSSFAYRIELGVFAFIVAIFLVMVPAILSISFKSLEVARVNPTDILGDE